MNASAIVLAAGKSERMGKMKLLLPFKGKTLIEGVVRPLLESSLDEVLVVLGYRGEEIKRALSKISSSKIRFVENRQYERGMLSSVQAGIRMLSAQTECAMVVLGDQPGFEANFFSRLLSEVSRSQKGILIPSYGGKRGHPLLISSRHFPFLLSLNPEKESLHRLTEEKAVDILDFPVELEEILVDVDLPQDLQRLKKKESLS